MGCGSGCRQIHVILSKNSATLKESDKDPFEITWIRNTGTGSGKSVKNRLYYSIY